MLTCQRTIDVACRQNRAIRELQLTKNKRNTKSLIAQDSGNNTEKRTFFMFHVTLFPSHKKDTIMVFHIMLFTCDKCSDVTAADKQQGVLPRTVKNNQSKR